MARFWLLAGIVSLAAALAAPAAASVFGGENGVVRLSFTPADSLTSVAKVAPGAGGVTVVDLWAYLDGVEPMVRDGEAFLGIGGFELKLVIEGAKGNITKQDFPFAHFNIGSELGACVVGIDPGQPLDHGRAALVHWQIVFVTPPEKVTFTLDPTALKSCETLPACVGSGIYGLYTGTVTARQMDSIFGTGCARAYLNWPTAPDTTPLHGTKPWRKEGVYHEPLH